MKWPLEVDVIVPMLEIWKQRGQAIWFWSYRVGRGEVCPNHWDVWLSVVFWLWASWVLQACAKRLTVLPTWLSDSWDVLVHISLLVLGWTFTLKRILIFRDATLGSSYPTSFLWGNRLLQFSASTLGCMSHWGAATLREQISKCFVQSARWLFWKLPLQLWKKKIPPTKINSDEQY